MSNPRKAENEKLASWGHTVLEQIVNQFGGLFGPGVSVSSNHKSRGISETPRHAADVKISVISPQGPKGYLHLERMESANAPSAVLRRINEKGAEETIAHVLFGSYRPSNLETLQEHLFQQVGGYLRASDVTAGQKPLRAAPAVA